MINHLECCRFQVLYFQQCSSAHSAMSCWDGVDEAAEPPVAAPPSGSNGQSDDLINVKKRPTVHEDELRSARLRVCTDTRGSSPQTIDYPTPPTGSARWMAPCFRALHNHHMAKGLFHQTVPIAIFDSCGGTLASEMCFQAFGIKVIAESSEGSAAAAKFMQQTVHKDIVQYIFKEFEEQSRGRRECWQHPNCRCSSMLVGRPRSSSISELQDSCAKVSTFSTFQRFNVSTLQR